MCFIIRPTYDAARHCYQDRHIFSISLFREEEPNKIFMPHKICNLDITIPFIKRYFNCITLLSFLYLFSTIFEASEL
jgi:hypothetical protein